MPPIPFGYPIQLSQARDRCPLIRVLRANRPQPSKQTLALRSARPAQLDMQQTTKQNKFRAFSFRGFESAAAASPSSSVVDSAASVFESD